MPAEFFFSDRSSLKQEINEHALEHICSMLQSVVSLTL